MRSPPAAATPFDERLFAVMRLVDPAVGTLEPYEFRYCLENVAPPEGWESVRLESLREIEERIRSRGFFSGIRAGSRSAGRVPLDPAISALTRTLLAGLATGGYPVEWVDAHFYFDVRGFFFLPRTVYFTEPVLRHFGGKPYRTFEQGQKRLASSLEVGYAEFREANREIDGFFIESILKLVSAKGTPILFTIAGPTAAGKTEIGGRLREALARAGRKASSIEMDNFLMDNGHREALRIDSMGKEAFHFSMFLSDLDALLAGRTVTIPRYENGVSSHTPDGVLKSDGRPIVVEPADIIFIEGNFPFQIGEVAHRIGIKVVYLTDDPVRLKRKWRRDIDLRKKYDVDYFRNRYFRTQFLRASDCYQAQMEACDVVVDTTGAALWATAETIGLLEGRS